MTGDAGFWLAFTVMVVGLSYIEHLRDADCRTRGGEVTEHWLVNECKEAK